MAYARRFFAFYHVRNMYSSLDMDIKPGVSVGPFELGTSLWSIMELIRAHHIQFAHVDLSWDVDAATTTPIILHIRPHVDLLFSPNHQRLSTIIVGKLRDTNPPVTLRYKDVVLASQQEVLRKVAVTRVLGPTYEGEDLRYPGLSFSFEDSSKAEIYTGKAEERALEVKRVLVFQKEDGEERDALDEVAECPIMTGDVARAIAKVHDGVLLHFHPSTSAPLRVQLGKTTAQDLTLDLGPPLRVHYKEDERMTIHGRAGVKETQPSYFYNYFQHGIDFLISGTTHKVRKIILHTNVPGSPLFQRYKRCPWEIEGKPEDDEDDSPPRMQFFDRFETISHFLSPRGTPPSMLLDRTEDEDGITLPNPTTRILGYDGIILEVTDASQVVSLTLF